jgi:hypothetical protein
LFRAVRGANDGPGEWYLYRGTSQLVKITRPPLHVGDVYHAKMVGFDGTEAENCEYNECDLHQRYAAGEKNLTFGTRVEFVPEKKRRSTGGLPIQDSEDTWVQGIVEATVRLRAYRIIHTLWCEATRSTMLTTSVVAFDRVRRRV